LRKQTVSRNHVVYEEDASNLLFVAVNSDWLIIGVSNGEPRNPTLILLAELVVTTNANHPKNTCFQTISVVVILSIEIFEKLRATVGRVTREVHTKILGDSFFKVRIDS